MNDLTVMVLTGIALAVLVTLIASFGIRLLERVYLAVNRGIPPVKHKEIWYNYNQWLNSFHKGVWGSAYPLNVILINSKVRLNNGAELKWEDYRLLHDNHDDIYPVLICPWVHFENICRTNSVILDGINDA